MAEQWIEKDFGYIGDGGSAGIGKIGGLDGAIWPEDGD